MLPASHLSARIQLDALPVLEGADSCLRAGLFSSLQLQNRKFSIHVRNIEEFSEHPLQELLFDPQTAGELLAAVPAERCKEIQARLIEAGYSDTTVIGTVIANESDSGQIASVTLK